MRKRIIAGILNFLCILSFVSTGAAWDECDPPPIVRGDVNGNGQANILDVIYLIDFLYKGGPAPTPYPIFSGDLNCDCKVDILDVVRSILYLYKCKGSTKCGWIPCSCDEWLDSCGLPFR